MTSKTIISLVLVATVVGTGVRFYTSDTDTSKSHLAVSTSFHVAVINDLSDSMPAHGGCNVVVGLVERALSNEAVARGSTISVYGTGSPSTAMEPVSILTAEIPTSRRVMEGKAAAEVKRKGLLDKVSASCKNVTGSISRSSPIYLAVRRGLEQLHAVGCNEIGSCHLLVRTDGEETEESWLKMAVKTGKLPKHGQPSPLDNRGVKVVMCGLSETRGEVAVGKAKRRFTPKRNSHAADALTAAWRKVFVEPGSVTFEPTCAVGRGEP